MKDGVDVREATHVRLRSGKVEKIVSKYGIDSEGRLAPPSKGGFGVITESGAKIPMWEARSYLKEEK